ncbi:MAG TPA: hypothetical protein VHN14_09540 [Kofleriaceae bacterium]|jgi:hypothetical protein|nr:hypothetical protein [Kofleriaceae bacterium]
MSRATWLLGATSVLGVSLSVWFYLDNRSLRAEFAHPAAAHPEPGMDPATSRPASPAAQSSRAQTSIARAMTAARPALPDPPKETRMERRARRTNEFAQMFGRLDGETEDDYKARVLPMIQTGLLMPRMQVEEQRKAAQDRAHVTTEQSARLDKLCDKIYSDVLDFTNKAIADRQLSPYERNVSGWLEYAGGLGSILNEANGQIGKILDPSQIRTMSEAGFEWGEYLGVKAPWEQLRPPPPRSR